MTVTEYRLGDRILTMRGAGIIIAIYRRSLGVWLDSGWHIHERIRL